jgi:hypothetical protein
LLECSNSLDSSISRWHVNTETCSKVSQNGTETS